MRAFRSAAAIAAILASSVVAAQTTTFGDVPPGKLPQDFEVGLTGGGPPPPPREQYIIVTLAEHRHYCVIELAIAAGADLTDEQRSFLATMRARFQVDA